MKNNLFVFCLFILMLLVPASLRTETDTDADVGGGAGPDSTSIARDGTRPPTANQDWANFDLFNVGSLELDDGANSMLMSPVLFGGTGGLLLDFPVGTDFTFGQGFNFSLYLQSSTGPAFLNLMSAPDDGSVDVGWSVVRDSGLGGGAIEGVNVAWRSALSSYSIDTVAISGGSNFPLRLNANGSFGGAGTPNMTLNTDGSITASGGALTVDGGSTITGSSATATTKTGPHLFIGTTAGVPTGVPSDSPAGRVPLSYDTTNGKICIYSGGWNCIESAESSLSTLTTVGSGVNTIDTLTANDDELMELTSNCSAISDDGSEGGSMRAIGTFRKDGAAAIVQVGATTVIYQNQDCGAGANACDLGMSISGTADVLVEVDGSAGATINWDCETIVRRRGA